MTQYLRAYRAENQAETGPIRFLASTAGIKRDGKSLRMDRWLLDNFQRNPVVLWVHDYMGRNLPIGTAAVGVEPEGLIAEVTFDAADQFAQAVEGKYRRGFLNAVSVGWEDRKQGTDTWHELLDVSAVPVPGDPDALIERQYRALQTLFEADTLGAHTPKRGAIPPHTTEKLDENAEWDGPGEVSQAEGAVVLRRMHSWVDEEQDPETKQAYKLPHHKAEGQVVWRGVAAAMARLLQAGTQIPDADRRGVYNHLSRHYSQFDREPPEFRSGAELAMLDEATWRGLFLEGELEISGYRVGAVLSARNRERLEQAVDFIQQVLASAQKETDAQAKHGDEDEDEKKKKKERALLEEIHQALLHVPVTTE